MSLLAALLLAAAPPPTCSIQRPAACGGMYELSVSRGFARALREFVGPGRATWYEPNADRTRQLLGIFYGPSSSPVLVNPSLLRFEACYPHVCTIRAALFVATTGQIRGAALLYADCSGRMCRGDESVSLTILRDPTHPEVAALAREWGEGDVASTNAAFEFAEERLGRIEVVDVRGNGRLRN